MARVRFDLHLHTEFSSDCDTALTAIEAHCLARGLTGIAVTDHDTIEGALRLQERVRSLQVIVGEEVTTRDGDVIGLFLQERIPPGMSAQETMEAIHAQNGLVYLPHPFDQRRARKSKGASLHTLVPLIDIVEPVMKSASSAVRNTTPRAMSSAWPRRPTGMRAMIFSKTSAGTARTMSVST